MNDSGKKKKKNTNLPAEGENWEEEKKNGDVGMQKGEQRFALAACLCRLISNPDWGRLRSPFFADTFGVDSYASAGGCVCNVIP